MGTLRTINGIEPDENGNVVVSAASVGALSKTGDTLEGMLNANGNRVTGLPLPSEDGDAVPYSMFTDSEKIAWSNAKIQSEFPAQTLTLTNSNAATKIIIEFVVSTDDDRIISTAEIVLPTSGITEKHVVVAPVRAYTGMTYFATRNFAVYGHKTQIRVSFESAYEGATEDNTKLIPQYITIVRKVS
jgi:hypothetical protein